MINNKLNCGILVTSHFLVSGVDELNKLTTFPRIIKTHLQVQFIPKSFWEQNSKVNCYEFISDRTSHFKRYGSQYFMVMSVSKEGNVASGLSVNPRVGGSRPASSLVKVLS